MRRVGLPSSSPREEEALKTLWGWLQLLETPSEELRRPGQGLVFVCAVQASTRKLLQQLRYLFALIYLHFLFFWKNSCQQHEFFCLSEPALSARKELPTRAAVGSWLNRKSRAIISTCSHVIASEFLQHQMRLEWRGGCVFLIVLLRSYMYIWRIWSRLCVSNGTMKQRPVGNQDTFPSGNPGVNECVEENILLMCGGHNSYLCKRAQHDSPVSWGGAAV